jgi:hypothetical protein
MCFTRHFIPNIIEKGHVVLCCYQYVLVVGLVTNFKGDCVLYGHFKENLDSSSLFFFTDLIVNSVFPCCQEITSIYTVDKLEGKYLRPLF